MGVLPVGVHWLLGADHEVMTFDVRPVSEIVGGQEVTTEDGGSFKISMIISHQIEDPALFYRCGLIDQRGGAANRWILGGSGASARSHQVVQIALRKWVTSRTFRDAYEQRSSLAADILPSITEEVAKLGIKVISLDLLDLTIVGGLRAAYADLLKTQIEGEAALARRQKRGRNDAEPAQYGAIGSRASRSCWAAGAVERTEAAGHLRCGWAG